MSDDDEGTIRRRGLRTTRMEAFSDGVFAIAITLLVLDISVPLVSSEDLLRQLADQWPSYLAYAVSFSTIGAIWFGHAAMSDYLDHANSVFMRLNLLLLMLVSFLPFPTRLLAQHIGNDERERVAATIYGLTLLVTSVMLALLWRYAQRAHLVRPDADDTELQVLTERLTPGLFGYLLLIVAGLFVPVVAVVGYLIVALYLIVPRRMVVRPRPPRPSRAERKRTTRQERRSDPSSG